MGVLEVHHEPNFKDENGDEDGMDGKLDNDIHSMGLKDPTNESIPYNCHETISVARYQLIRP